MRIIKLNILLAAFTLLFFSCGSGHRGRVMVIVDPALAEAAKGELAVFTGALEADDLTPVVLIDTWYNPDSLRAAIRKEYDSPASIEGVIFIGDIPVAMIRNAQHMASAFKMDQARYPFTRSSVASDRFYDDFDLTFDFLKQDEKETHQFYYNLRYDSPQVLSPDIYSGRIRLASDPGYEKIKAYLLKAAAAHTDRQEVDEMLFFAGHGYNSESFTARIDEKVSLLQQFPEFNRQENGLEFIDHTFDDHPKFRLLSKLTDRDLDIALLHHHGSINAQLLSGEPAASGVNQNIENIKIYLRSKARDAADRGRDVNAAMKDYVERLDVPYSWFDGSFDEGQILLDSIYWADMDISGDELTDFKPGARFVMFDACFNGSFQKDSYLASRYIFSEGNTVATQANSVNVIQDKFPDEMVGLLALGMRVGELNRHTCFLETHIIGDPTFRFKGNSGDFDASVLPGAEGSNKKLVKLAGSGHPDIESWALHHLYNNGYSDISNLCREKYFSSEFNVTRMECLKILSLIRDKNYVEVTGAALDDSYELVRRMAAVNCLLSGDPALIPDVAKALIDPNISKRVRYQLQEAVAFFDRDMMKEACRAERAKQSDDSYIDSMLVEQVERIDRGYTSYRSYIDEVISEETKERDREFAIRALRNKPFHQGVPELGEYLLASDNSAMQVMLLEALGWFDNSYRREEINNICNEIIRSDRFTAEVKEEAERTRIRLR